MKVTVVIPVFNRVEVILPTLESVARQTLFDFECLIIDDGSTDHSVSVVDQYISSDSRFRLIQRNRLPKGANTCRNIGLKQARAEYILFLDSDDIIADNFLESQVEYIMNKSCDAVISRIFEFDNDIKDNLIEREIGANLNLNSYIKNQCSWITSAVLWNKKSIEKINGFDEGIMKWQDWLLNIKALSKDYCFCQNFETNVFYCIAKNIKRTSNSGHHADEFFKTRLKALNYLSNKKERKLLLYHFNVNNLKKVRSNYLTLKVLFQVTFNSKSFAFLKGYLSKDV
ncbi:glycosyltransferase family 2 protein [Mangrovimonas sp. DI 80]|uniref:glycosyltransferase family 2 protein n=1 Tax=Mangrovimonas sp. DI 80 TaxID=1779330 RepID=UPI0009765B7C|nr:glycosyltransferase family 2 protein [Mangrovimonas sp. DI 80]OMP31790.1 hypothetical protein BKM32_01640 [Mangrovimonas sp. DI 80]